MSSSDSNVSPVGDSNAQRMRNNLRSKPYKTAWPPTLDDVLNNKPPPPYNLRAFTKYLSQNHCLENLEFILEAKRYRQRYESLVEAPEESRVTTYSSRISLSMLYQFLLTTYILPGAPREVNLSVNVRDALLRYRNMSTPPLPETLDPAVKSIHDLMEDSIFFSFLNSSSTDLHRDPMLKGSNQNDSSSNVSGIISDNQPTRSIRTKRPTLNPLGRRVWSWPPWNRQAG